MSKKIAPRVQLNFEPEMNDNDNDDLDLIDDDLELDMPCGVPDIIGHAEIVKTDIFDLKLKDGEDDMSIDEMSEPSPPPLRVVLKKTKPKVISDKPKRKLSEEHKAKLALAREKALITRRNNAEEKKKMKEIQIKTKELKKKKAQKDLEQLEDEVINDKPVKSSTSDVFQQSFTKKDLEDAQLDAIMKYEAIRKTRKVEKKKQQLIDQQKQDLKNTIQGYGAKDDNGRLINKWNRCY